TCNLERQESRRRRVEGVADEIDVAQAGLFGQRGGELRLEEPAAGKEGLAEAHAGDLDLFERFVESLVRDPALLHEDRAQHRTDLVLEIAVVETKRGGGSGSDPKATAEIALVRRCHLCPFRSLHRPGRSL